MSWDEGYWPERRPRLAGPGPRRAGRRGFGASWWGTAWVQALEGRARLDPNRLPRGRTYARTGAVGTLVISAGEVQAKVQGSRQTPYDVRVRVRTFDAAEWGRVLDALASEIGRTAALLDGELPPEVAADAAKVGLDLLPGPGELQPRCSCPDFADPCKHAAAVCYLVADALDEDPFGVLLLRGMRRDEVLAALRARRRVELPGAPPAAAAAGLAASEDPGVAARDAWRRSAGSQAHGAESKRLPPPPPLPLRPGVPTVLAADPPGGSGLDVAGLRALAADAAARALELARGAGSGFMELDEGEDLARRAAALLAADARSAPVARRAGAHGAKGSPAAAGDAGSPGPLGGPAGGQGLAELARRAGVPARELFARALAFRDGGTGALAALLEAWDPPAELAGAGRALLGPGARLQRNRVTLGERQLRLGRDGRWYPMRRQRNDWLPDGPPLEAGAMVDEAWGELEEAGESGGPDRS